jgi:hypothetical protein
VCPCRSVCLAGVQINCKEGQHAVPSAYHLPDVRSALSASATPGTRGFRFACMLQTPCGAADVSSLDIHSRQRCPSHPVCGQYGEGGHREEPRPNPPHCVNCSGAHASADMKCSVFPQEKAIQEFRAKHGLSFMGAPKTFHVHQPTIVTQSFTTAVCRPRGIDAANLTGQFSPTYHYPVNLHMTTPSPVLSSPPKWIIRRADWAGFSLSLTF